MIVNLGTGIGGGIVIDGRVQRGRYGIAGEFGHMQVVPNGLRCECGNRGCWEQYASGNALVREARGLIAARSPVANDLLAGVGGDPSRSPVPASPPPRRPVTPPPSSCSPRSALARVGIATSPRPSTRAPSSSAAG